MITPDTSNITAQGFIADIARSPSSNSDSGSITDAEVQNSQGENIDTNVLTALPVDMSAKSEVKEAPILLPKQNSQSMSMKEIGKGTHLCLCLVFSL